MKLRDLLNGFYLLCTQFSDATHQDRTYLIVIAHIDGDMYIYDGIKCR